MYINVFKLVLKYLTEKMVNLLKSFSQKVWEVGSCLYIYKLS